MINVYALCQPIGSAIVKHVSVTRDLQEHLEGLFLEFERQFREDVELEVDFVGGWNADSDELFRVPLPPEAQSVVQQLHEGAVGREDLNLANIEAEGIRALIVPVTRGQVTSLLIQNFSSQQILTRKWALIAQGNSFRRIDEAALTISNKVDGLIEGDNLKFKSFHVMRQVFDLTEFFREASDADIVAFAEHEKIAVDNPQQLCAQANQTHRKLIFAISHNNKLDELEVNHIQQQAAHFGIALQLRDGKVVIPNDRTLKHILMFLDDAIYSSPLRGDHYMTNSKRPFGIR